jgi:hypothetical protein
MRWLMISRDMFGNFGSERASDADVGVEQWWLTLTGANIPVVIEGKVTAYVYK